MLDHTSYLLGTIPVPVEFYLDRPRVDQLIKNAIRQPLTVVVAGAGYGKTQAVSSLEKDPDLKLIWLQLSVLDNLAFRFWIRIVHSFRTYSAHVSEKLDVLGFPETLALYSQFISILENELDSKQHYVIVFDDFHLIEDCSVLNFITTLIEVQIKNFSIVLISRVRPSLKLAFLQSRGLVSMVESDDLRFTKKEFHEYFKLLNISLTNNILDHIYKITEGWIFAIHLISLVMIKKQSSASDIIHLAKIDIFDLMETEIFNLASMRLKDFLIILSILDFLPKGLMEILPGYDESLFFEMSKLNVFVYFDTSSNSYRFHHLFREFLQMKNEQLTIEQCSMVHKTAATWFEINGYLPEAVEHYLRCGAYDSIFNIILHVDRHVIQEVAESFIRIIDHAPKHFIHAQPIILVVKAYYLFNNNRLEEAYELLSDLQSKYESLPKTQQNLALLGEVYILLGLLSIVNQTFDFEVLFHLAYQYLPNGSSLVDAKLNIAEGLNICGIKRPIPGELERYYNAMMNTMPIASLVMNGCGFGAEYLNAADSHLMTGNFKEAVKNAYIAIGKASEKEQYDIVCMATFILLRVFVQRGQYKNAVMILDQMKSHLNKPNFAEVTRLFQVVEGWFYVKLNEPSKVADWIRNEEKSKSLLPPVILGREYLVHSDSMLIDGLYDELLAFMVHTDILYEEHGILYALIQNKITKSIIYCQLQNTEQCLQNLEQAYELSNPNKLIIQFIEYGNYMRSVIALAKKNPNCNLPIEWLNQIATKSSTYAKNLSRLRADYKRENTLLINSTSTLSKREKEILVLLCNGLTRVEISDNCSLSINTVKSTINSIFNKIGAINVADAVRIATTQKLI